MGRDTQPMDPEPTRAQGRAPEAHARPLNIPPRFPRPADDATVQVVTLYGPPGPTEAPAGWLLYDATADSLEWISAHHDDPNSVPAIVATDARTAVLYGLRDGKPAGQVCQALRLAWLSTAPRTTTAPEVRAEAAEAWATLTSLE